MKEWLAYALVSVVLRLTGALPRRLARGLAVGVARILFTVTPKLRKTAEFNLKLAFPEWTDAQRAATAQGMVRSLGWMAAEFAMMPRYTRENIEKIIVLDGLENFLEGQRRGKGVLFFVCIVGTFYYGMYIGSGRVVYASTADVFSMRFLQDRWQYVCQVGAGLPAGVPR